MRYAQLASCCDVMVSETLAGHCQGHSENWRANCVDAMQRACLIAPDNEEWKTRLAYFEACAEDEKIIEEETRGVEAEARQVEVERRQEEAEGNLLVVNPADETVSSQSQYSHVEQNGDAYAIREALHPTASPRGHAAALTNGDDGQQEMSPQQEERIDIMPSQALSPEQAVPSRRSSPRSLRAARTFQAAVPHVEQQLSILSPPSIPLPASPNPGTVSHRTSASRLAEETDLHRTSAVHDQLAAQQKVNAHLLERLDRLEQEMGIMREQQDISLGLNALERGLRKLRERQDALDRRTR